MDLLDSILKGMEKPPTIKKPVIKNKEQREKLEKLQKERQEAAKKQKELVNKFRIDIASKIKKFVDLPKTEDPNTTKLVLKPMSKIYRSIVHETCEEYEDEIVVYSFGTEELDRHCVIWKSGFEPCEEEIRAMKLGIEYKPAKKDDDEEEEPGSDQQDVGCQDGKDKFWGKYEKIIGQNASGVESARVALPAKQYGCVPIENKKDQRSIEQMMDDIRKSKRQKTSNDEPSASSSKDSNTTDTKEQQ